MSDIDTIESGKAVVEDLFHYGVKGMKWGVRNDKGHEGERVKTKKLEKLDKKWEADMNRNAYMKLYNAACDKMNKGGIDAINNKPEYKDVTNFLDPKNAELYDRYLAEHEAAFRKAFVEAGPSLGMNPSGTKQYVIRKDSEGNDDVFLDPVSPTEVKHAEGDTRMTIRLKTDPTGRVTKYSVEEQVLKHFGVKGMKWGVRKTEADGSPRQRGAVRQAITKAAVSNDEASRTIHERNAKKTPGLSAERMIVARQRTVERTRDAAADINMESRFKGKDIKYDAPLQEAYRKEVAKKAAVIYEEEIRHQYTEIGVEATIAAAKAIYNYKKGTTTVTLDDQTAYKAEAVRQILDEAKAAKHADDGGDPSELVLKMETNELGHVVDVSLVGSKLAHYGVKGMKWGVRKSDRGAEITKISEKQSRRESDKQVVVSQRKPGTYVKTKGGNRNLASEDAIKAQASRQRAKRSTTDSLTNAELKQLNERMRLEQEFSKLDKKVKRQGEGFISRLFRDPEIQKQVLAVL